MAKPLRIALVAGELSGDILGADLMSALRILYPHAQFEGIGGPRMQAEGMTSFFPMEKLSVMGLVEVLKHLPELLGIRKALVKRWHAEPPDIFIGIDAPDFNLGLAKRLHRVGIKTVHYVSPSVWAWRQGRVKGIKRSIDLMLTLFPFEARFYQQAGVPVCFVGHPLAEQLPWQPEQSLAREQLSLAEGPVLALLPGSRRSEVSMLGPAFIEAARLCKQAKPELQIVLAPANQWGEEFLQPLLADLPCQFATGKSQLAMQAADMLMLASGTVTLEAALCKRPMVVAYRMASWTFSILKRLVKVPHIALPNLLTPRPLVRELLQDEVTPQALAHEALHWLEGEHQSERHVLQQQFLQLHQQLRQGGGKTAAAAIAKLLESSCS
ncbi:lipid-A-disaccharide synthase [Balneatrix alpica]|uniref:lipid-A-disaccharide synthase n=1 Tax=Balneatrix alpica TaxID=75684 RepID=UPI0027390114|nr:lipid-A-disaccharide synthase [Balneatrix alpica]